MVSFSFVRHYRPLYLTMSNMPEFNLKTTAPCSPFCPEEKDPPANKQRGQRYVPFLFKKSLATLTPPILYRVLLKHFKYAMECSQFLHVSYVNWSKSNIRSPWARMSWHGISIIWPWKWSRKSLKAWKYHDNRAHDRCKAISDHSCGSEKFWTMQL